MTEDKEEVLGMQEVNLPDEKEYAVVIHSQEELMSFLMDILDIGDNVETEEMLENNNSYRILSSVLKKIPVLTIAIESRHVDRIYGSVK